MAHKCFLSFHYKPDNWRVQKVKQMGAIEGQALLDSNGWESVKRGGDAAIQKWIDDNMKGRDCLVVLVGEKTAGRRWVNYEIKRAWASLPSISIISRIAMAIKPRRAATRSPA
jgi:hypothetical protein